MALSIIQLKSEWLVVSGLVVSSEEEISLHAGYEPGVTGRSKLRTLTDREIMRSGSVLASRDAGLEFPASKEPVVRMVVM